MRYLNENEKRGKIFIGDVFNLFGCVMGGGGGCCIGGTTYTALTLCENVFFNFFFHLPSQVFLGKSFQKQIINRRKKLPSVHAY